MARGINKVIIVGNLGADPEVKTFDNGGSITNINVATSEQWNDRNTGERQERTEWHRITFNNKLAEIAAQYLRKGSKVYVEGSLRTRKWQDQNGQDRYTTEIRANELQMLDSRGQGQDNMGAPSQSSQQNFGNNNFGGSRPQSNNQNNAFNAPNNSRPSPQPSPQYSDDFDDDIPF